MLITQPINKHDAEATGQTLKLRKGSQTCYGGVSMDGDYVAYMFETTTDGTPTGRFNSLSL